MRLKIWCVDGRNIKRWKNKIKEERFIILKKIGFNGFKRKIGLKNGEVVKKSMKKEKLMIKSR